MATSPRRIELATCGDCPHLNVAWGGEFGCKHPAVLKFSLARAVRELTEQPVWFAPLESVELDIHDAPDPWQGTEYGPRPRVHRECPFRKQD